MIDIWQHIESGMLHTQPWVLSWYVRGEWRLLGKTSVEEP